MDEPRAVHLTAKLKAKTWDLPALRTLAAGGAEVTKDVLDTLRGWRCWPHRTWTRCSPRPRICVRPRRRRRCSRRTGDGRGPLSRRGGALEEALRYHDAHRRHRVSGLRHRNGCVSTGARVRNGK